MTDKTDAEATANAPVLTAREVRDGLVKHLADSLRDLPHQQRTFLLLPRYQVPTEWSHWIPEQEPSRQLRYPNFNMGYEFAPPGQWDAEIVRDRLHELWLIWGWKCEARPSPMDGYELTGETPDGSVLTLVTKAERRKSYVRLVSPPFIEPEPTVVAMPFAVTPFGPLSLPVVWAAFPDLITW